MRNKKKKTCNPLGRSFLITLIIHRWDNYCETKRRASNKLVDGRNRSLSQVGEHISLGICVSLERGTHITKDTCFPGGGTHITRDTCFPGGGTHITRDMCFPGGGTHITRDMCFPGRGTHITRDMCFLGWGTHITRDTCFLGRGTHITRDMCFPRWRNT